MLLKLLFITSSAKRNAITLILAVFTLAAAASPLARFMMPSNIFACMHT